ncbi:hypothetical protein J4443_03700 [Candidatus Woesearchaeota archaeon]|nr:hypothetical protein [Candidatus Woesearchaeota archaeon]
MLKWLFKKHFKEELNSHFDKLHLNLSRAFLNIKDDINSIHKHLNEKSSKLYEVEKRLIALEHRLEYSSEQGLGKGRIAQIAQRGEIELEDESQGEISLIEHSGLTETQKIILVAIYELEKQHNSPISFKSLATFLYPGKNYSSIRTTISDYLDILATYGFVKKEKVKRETITITTKKGKELAKEVLKQKKQRERRKVTEEI